MQRLIFRRGGKLYSILSLISHRLVTCNIGRCRCCAYVKENDRSSIYVTWHKFLKQCSSRLKKRITKSEYLTGVRGLPINLRGDRIFGSKENFSFTLSSTDGATYVKPWKTVTVDYGIGFCHIRQENVVVQSLTHQGNDVHLKSPMWILSNLLSLVSHPVTFFPVISWGTDLQRAEFYWAPYASKQNFTLLKGVEQNRKM